MPLPYLMSSETGPARACQAPRLYSRTFWTPSLSLGFAAGHGHAFSAAVASGPLCWHGFPLLSEDDRKA